MDGKLKKSDLQRLEKMASKPDPPTQASMAKALNDSASSHASRVTQKFLTDQQKQFLRPQQRMPNSSGAAQTISYGDI
ncbi:hypothetical protein AVEN_73467-1 [Araneus ventricosus]|uniref:Uncharacterized protein n=1 Tax=Araneus ventricosus TaxID=182803 RepID=A0A4Y2LTN1_ARAVE|nr:hypothetical protein AVEN_73467-1 [Araneus ventricosus]